MINLLLARHFGFATNSYIIYRGKYLIEESQKKVTTAYNNFYKKELKKVAKPEAITTEMKRIGQQWSTLSATDRSAYESSSAEKTLAAEAKQAYIYKYVTPFKRYNIYSFFVEKFMKNNQLKQEFSGQTKNIVDNYRALAAPDKEKLLKELTSINDARAKIV